MIRLCQPGGIILEYTRGMPREGAGIRGGFQVQPW